MVLGEWTCGIGGNHKKSELGSSLNISTTLTISLDKGYSYHGP